MPLRTCEWCTAPIRQAATGRTRRFCDSTCRQAAYHRASHARVPRTLATPGTGRRMATTSHVLIGSMPQRPQWPDSETGVRMKPVVPHSIHCETG